MYIGRFLVVGPEGGAYRVSSRSFPNRKIVARDGTLTVVPTDAAEPVDNPYVSYNCLRVADGTAVFGNGSHVDPITEKVELGYPPRDALATGLLALDYEKDAYDTPRIAAACDGEEAFIATVRRDALLVQEVDEPTLIATYELDEPTGTDLAIGDAETAATAVFQANYEHTVCAAGVSVTEAGIETAIVNGA